MNYEVAFCLIWPASAVIATIVTAGLTYALRKRQRTSWMAACLLAAGFALFAAPVPAPLTCPVPGVVILAMAGYPVLTGEGLDMSGMSMLLGWTGPFVLTVFVLALAVIRWIWRRRR